MKRQSVFACLMCAAISLIGFAQTPSAEQGVLIVNVPTARVMAGAALVAEVRLGQRLPFTQRNGDWYFVEFQQDGSTRRGWIHRDDARFDEHSGTASPRNVAGWGTLLDPLGDCRIAERTGTVSFSVPGKYRDLITAPHVDTNAPRIMQDVEGDFTLQVLARRFPMPQAKTAANPKLPSYVSSGLLIWQDGHEFLRLQRAANGDQGKTFIHANQFTVGKLAANSTAAIADEDTYLRIVRQGDQITLAHSRDGRSWSEIQPRGQPKTFSPRVKVGVFVINATTRDIVHEFADFQLTLPSGR